MKFEDLIAKVHSCGRQTLAVAAAEDDAVLEAVAEAHKQGIADAILVGDEPAIRKIAADLQIDLSDYRIIHEPDKAAAAHTAVKLAHDGEADMYMKGLLDTKTFLKSILDKEVGLRTGKTLSDYIIDIRLGFATRMLVDSTRTIAEVCYDCGFNNLSNFNRMFKRKKGCSPKEFRENYRKKKLVI